ncbi:hypothetical protein ACFXPA_04815 [Amycolatopsis sp. NPDC059090]|uniref:hypothetical protein n=1 Tax=unclassified Amycolatopsis TaxID=2618356 RepID=UPI003670A82A
MNASSHAVARLVTITMGLVIGLTFLFGFGNVLSLALKLQVPAFVAPLVAPAVDLTVLGLLVGTRHLALSGADDDVLRPARRLLLAASVVTLLLNVADPVCAGQWGKAAFDSVGPFLLIGWAEAGPGLLRALSTLTEEVGDSLLASAEVAEGLDGTADREQDSVARQHGSHAVGGVQRMARIDEDLVERARRADVEHWRRYRRPISAETLRKQLRVGARASRDLVALVRSENAYAQEVPQRVRLER